jgi:hypothetical protein
MSKVNTIISLLINLQKMNALQKHTYNYSANYQSILNNLLGLESEDYWLSFAFMPYLLDILELHNDKIINRLKQYLKEQEQEQDIFIAEDFDDEDVDEDDEDEFIGMGQQMERDITTKPLSRICNDDEIRGMVDLQRYLTALSTLSMTDWLANQSMTGFARKVAQRTNDVILSSIEKFMNVDSQKFNIVELFDSLYKKHIVARYAMDYLQWVCVKYKDKNNAFLSMLKKTKVMPSQFWQVPINSTPLHEITYHQMIELLSDSQYMNTIIQKLPSWNCEQSCSDLLMMSLLGERDGRYFYHAWILKCRQIRDVFALIKKDILARVPNPSLIMGENGKAEMIYDLTLIIAALDELHS